MQDKQDINASKFSEAGNHDISIENSTDFHDISIGKGSENHDISKKAGLDYESIGMITGRQGTIFVSEPFELMKGLKPYEIDEICGDIRKKITIRIKNPDYETFRKDFIEREAQWNDYGSDEEMEEDVRFYYEDNYGIEHNEYNFYKLLYIKLEKGNCYLFTDYYKPVIAYEPGKEPGFEDERFPAREILEKTENTIQEHIGFIREGRYKEEVIDKMPFTLKTGTMKRADRWRVTEGLPPDAPFEEFQFPSRDRFMELAGSEDLEDSSKIKERIKEMTASIFYDCCYAGYKANPQEDYNVKDRTPKESYLYYSDGRDDGLTEIDDDSPEAFDKWHSGKRFGGHPWEVCRGGNSTHVALYVWKDRERGGYFMEVAGSAWTRFVEAINFYLAIRDMGYPVILRDAGLLLKRLTGEEIIGIVPNGTMPAYCEDMFPDEEVRSFMNIYEDEKDLLPYIRWQEMPIPEIEG